MFSAVTIKKQNVNAKILYALWKRELLYCKKNYFPNMFKYFFILNEF